MWTRLSVSGKYLSMTERIILIDIIPSQDGSQSVYVGRPGASEFLSATHHHTYIDAERIAKDSEERYTARGFTVDTARLQINSVPREGL